VTEADTTIDAPGIEQVYEEHLPPLRRLAFLLTGSREQAEDIVQAAFATAIPRWEQIGKPVPYLRQAVVNLANDGHRRRARERRRFASPEQITHLPEVDEAWAHIQRLPYRQQVVVVLRFYEDLALADIARLSSRSPATVRSDLHRALNRLRKVLG
jgi:RNA polymerase sigma factor (sigma-70 family)